MVDRSERETFVQVVPAPGWRVVRGWIEGDNVKFEDCPVLGWAIVHAEALSSENEERYDDHLDLIVYDDSSEWGISLATFGMNQHQSGIECITLQPDEELTEQRKAIVERDLRRYRETKRANAEAA